MLMKIIQILVKINAHFDFRLQVRKRSTNKTQKFIF